MDELQQAVIEQLPADGSPITFDEWKGLVTANVGAKAVKYVANKYNRETVNYIIEVGVGGALNFQVARRLPE